MISNQESCIPDEIESLLQGHSELAKLIALYSDAKKIILYSEEVDPTFKSNIQVIKELRDAFDHMMRAIITKSNGGTDITYYNAQIDKAVGHVYRAAFDALDGTVLSLRLKIIEALSGYDLSVIKELLPDYWEIKKFLNELTKKVSENRAEKDIKTDHSELFDKYVAEVDELKKIYDELLSIGSLLDECQKEFVNKNKKTNSFAFNNSIFAAIAGAIVSGILVWVISYYQTASPSNEINHKQAISTSQPTPSVKSVPNIPSVQVIAPGNKPGTKIAETKEK